MDERTEAQKVTETAARSEPRTIGYRPSTKVLVIAPTYDEARRWAHEHGISYPDAVFIGPSNFVEAMQGVRGAQHVILRWWGFTALEQEMIKELIAVAQCVPYEEDGHVDAPTSDVWS